MLHIDVFLICLSFIYSSDDELEPAEGRSNIIAEDASRVE